MDAAVIDDNVVDDTVKPGKTNSVDLSEISARRAVEKADSIISPPSKRRWHHTATEREGPPIHVMSGVACPLLGLTNHRPLVSRGLLTTEDVLSAWSWKSTWRVRRVLAIHPRPRSHRVILVRGETFRRNSSLLAARRGIPETRW